MQLSTVIQMKQKTIQDKSKNILATIMEREERYKRIGPLRCEKPDDQET
jgi:hypothetical protein